MLNAKPICLTVLPICYICAIQLYYIVDMIPRFPAPPTDLCRYGDPFRGSSHPIVEFQAAIGTSSFGTDVAAFQKVSG